MYKIEPEKWVTIFPLTCAGSFVAVLEDSEIWVFKLIFSDNNLIIGTCEGKMSVFRRNAEPPWGVQCFGALPYLVKLRGKEAVAGYVKLLGITLKEDYIYHE